MLFTKLIEKSYKHFLKPVYFKFDPEFVHDRILSLGELLGKFSITRKLTKIVFSYNNTILSQKVSGIKFANPIGLSAGFDKDARLINIIPDVGFAFTEVGSVTYHAYDGNPKPRLYRLKKDKGLVVYYGLKNEGVQVIAENIKRKYLKRRDFVLGVSIARTNSKDAAELEKGVQDYANSLKYLVNNNIGEYYTINISCPNTFHGEPFTTPDKLERLLKELKTIKTNKPIFIKMPINLPWKEFDELLKLIVRYNFNGVIIGNLNKDKNSEYITETMPENVKGGVSGKPTQKLSNDLISKTYQKYSRRLDIIGVGGIFDADDAYEKIKLGASLVQIITGMVFNGPQLIGDINKKLAGLLENDGYKNIKEAVGSANRN
jgi:dihydroorotate dehydrogenase